jgi:uncharacterized protein (UPF0332 family)
MSNTKFEKCLQRGFIREFSRGPALVPKEIHNAELDLKSAEESFKNKSYKWATIQAYYSMFHTARALLYAKGYREKSHWCLIESMRTFYIDKGKIGFWLVETLQQAKTLREEADYYGDFSQSKAEDIIEKTEEFLIKAKEILEIPNL